MLYRPFFLWEDIKWNKIHLIIYLLVIKKNVQNLAKVLLTPKHTVWLEQAMKEKYYFLLTQ